MSPRPKLDLRACYDEAKRELARKSLAHYARRMWSVIEPTTPLIWNWHHDAVCDHLEAVHKNQIRNLLICVPPRSLKSTFVSVMFPTWEWTDDPTHRYLTSSYALKLAMRDAVRSRRMMQSALYQALITDDSGEKLWRFTGDQNEKQRYENSRTGFRLCTSPESGGLGEGGSRIIGDDVLSSEDADSDSIRKGTNDWWDRTMSTRVNDPHKSAKILVMQRLHEDDVAGHVIEQGGYEVLSIPSLYECDHPMRRTTSIGWSDPRIEDGEMLIPDRVDEEAIEEAKLRLGPYGFAGQHQQRPAPATGGMLQQFYFNFWTNLPARWDMFIQSWDFSFIGKDDKRTHAAEVERVKNPDFVVGDAWGFVGANAYLVDEVRGQWEFTEALDQVVLFCKRWPKTSAKLFEDKANGEAMKSMLRNKIPGIIDVTPQGSKVQRVRAVQPYVQAYNVWLPHPSIAPWIIEWLSEVCIFPLGKKDDRVDTFTQALIYRNVDNAETWINELKALASMN